MTEIDDTLIGRIADKIKTHFKPHKIILFGSRAWGRPSPDSDLDLFIVMPSSLRRDNRGMEISKLFSDRLFPLDVLVYTPEEVASSLGRNNPFIKEILGKGKVIYEK